MNKINLVETVGSENFQTVASFECPFEAEEFANECMAYQRTRPKYPEDGLNWEKRYDAWEKRLKRWIKKHPDGLQREGTGYDDIDSYIVTTIPHYARGERP